MRGREKISIIIPVKNGADTLEKCLKGIYSQTLIHETEVIIIDSGSDDGTLTAAKKFPVRIFEIDPEEFNHGSTRNLGARHAQGEFVVMTVQDAWPADKYWLEHLIKHFSDPVVAGVCGQQIVPHENDKNPIEWFRPQSDPTITSFQFKDASGFQKLSPAEKRKVCGWDDVTSMYRKSVLEEIPFQPISFQEDCYWAKEAILKGYKIVYDTNARVNHYHNFSYRQYFERKLIEFKADYAMFELIPERFSFLYKIFHRLYWCIKLRLSPKWIAYNLTKIFAAYAAQQSFKRKIKGRKPGAFLEELLLS